VPSVSKSQSLRFIAHSSDLTFKLSTNECILMNKTESCLHGCEQNMGRIIKWDPDCVNLDCSHPVIRRLAVEDQVELLGLVKDFAECLPLYNFEWSDRVSASERTAWTSPVERLLNHKAWSCISTCFPQSLQADVEEGLHELEITSRALNFLDSDDQESLYSALGNAVAMAHFHRKSFKSSVETELRRWLQEWTDSDEDDLNVLISSARRMEVPINRREKVNWRDEGF